MLWVCALTSAAAAFFTQVLFANTLAPNEYGDLASALAIISLLSPLAGFGLQGFLLEAFGSEGWRAIRWIPPSATFMLTSTSVSAVALALWASFGSHDLLYRSLLYWFIPLIPMQPCMELVSGKLQLEERYKTLAAWQGLPNIVRLALFSYAALTTTSGLDLIAIGHIYACVSVAAVFLSLPQLYRMSAGRFALKGHGKCRESLIDRTDVTPSLWTLAKKSWPFGLAGFFYIIYYQSDIVLLRYQAGDAAAGLYNVAFTVMMSTYLLPGVIYQKFLVHKLHRLSKTSPSLSLRFYRYGNAGMLVLGMLTTLMVLLAAPTIVPVIFGRDYQGAIEPLKILAFCAPIHFVANSAEVLLFTNSLGRIACGVMGLTATINVSLNLSLIPVFGMKGAAASTLFSESAAMMLLMFIAKRRLGLNEQ